MKSVLIIHWKDWCWSWNSNTLATWCEELTHWKRPWYWERLKAEGEGDNRGCDGWLASPTQLTWVWASSRRRWWTGKPGMLQSMGSQRVGDDWVSELNWDTCWMSECKWPLHPWRWRIHPWESCGPGFCPLLTTWSVGKFPNMSVLQSLK